MRKTILWSALLALGTVTGFTDTPSLPDKTNAPIANPAPGTQTPSLAPQPTANLAPETPALLTINCDMKLDAKSPVNQNLLLTWSEKAVSQSFDFSPDTIDMQMNKLKACYTNDGWTGFNEALKKSGNLDAIKAQHLMVSSQIDGQTKIFETKDNLWKLSLPLQVVYKNDKEKVTQLLTVQLTVGRKPTGELGIAQMIATPRVAETSAGSPPVPEATDAKVPDTSNMQNNAPPASTPTPTEPKTTDSPAKVDAP